MGQLLSRNIRLGTDEIVRVAYRERLPVVTIGRTTGLISNGRVVSPYHRGEIISGVRFERLILISNRLRAGDSGGPVFVYRNGYHYLIGIITADGDTDSAVSMMSLIMDEDRGLNITPITNDNYAIFGHGIFSLLPNGTYELRGFRNNFRISGHITIPSRFGGRYITRIGSNAFANQQGLTSVTLPNTLTAMGNNAFAGTSIAEISIPSSVVNIGSGAFENTANLTSVTFLPNSQLQTIGPNAFRGSGIRNIIIPSSVTSIEYSAFENTANLRNVTFSSTSQLQHIRVRAFMSSGITNITIPNSVTLIASGAFENTLSLARIDVAEGNRHFASKNGILYNVLREFVHIPLALGGHVEIPLGVQIIPKNAFEGRRITSIFIPSTVRYIGVGAFRNARYLESVEFCEWFRPGRGDLPVINYHAFYGTSSLRSFSIPMSVTAIRCHAFERSGLESLFIPWNISTIGNYAFANTRNLNRLEFESEGGSVSIGFGAFEGSDLRSIDFSHTVISIGAFAFAGNRNLTSITFNGDSWLRTIGDFAFEGSDLRSLHIPASVTRIGNNAFAHNRSLTSLTFGSGLTDIGNNAFEGTRLTEVTIPQTVTHIGTRAFAYNRYLTSVTFAPNGQLATIGNHAFEGTGITEIVIPNSITHIGNSAFANSSLTSVEFEDNSSLISIGDNAFFGVNITDITLPNTLQIIGDATFSRTALESVVIPRSVTRIGHSAFRDNRVMVSVFIPSSVIFINTYAFFNCPNLTIFAEPLQRPIGWQIGHRYYFPWHGFSPVVWDATVTDSLAMLCDDADIEYEYILALYVDDTANTLPEFEGVVVTSKQADEYNYYI
ncbi:MAG: leucine-rich repeat domain-containing protein [Firmicutes bacterium]|nr:leucine-rich repeat domain-containing protein [Bacillota bacterium]